MLSWTRLPDYAEFPLDFVWLEKAIGKERSVLAVEAEWGSPVHHQNEDLDKIAVEVEAEFSKLLCYKTPLKVMVYTSEGNAEPQGKVQHIAATKASDCRTSTCRKGCGQNHCHDANDSSLQ